MPRYLKMGNSCHRSPLYWREFTNCSLGSNNVIDMSSVYVLGHVNYVNRSFACVGQRFICCLVQWPCEWEIPISPPVMFVL